MHLLRFVLRMRHLVGKSSSSPSPLYLRKSYRIENLQILQTGWKFPTALLLQRKTRKPFVFLHPSQGVDSTGLLWSSRLGRSLYFLSLLTSEDEPAPQLIIERIISSTGAST